MIGINIKTAYFTLLSYVPMFKVIFCDLDSLATVLDVYFNINIGFFSKFSITEWKMIAASFSDVQSQGKLWTRRPDIL